MKHFYRLFIALIIFASLLAACAPASTVEEEEIKPVSLEPVAGTDLNHVILTADAAKRLDIQTVAVRDADVTETPGTVIPYDAVLYEANGNTWVYISIEPLVFVRQAIVIDHIKGNEAFLSEGPDSGSMVVTLGAAELYGSESEFEEE
jgi:hypothetical protein